MEKKYKRLLSDMLVFALGAIGSKLIMFILLPLYTNVLSDAEYGIADLVFTAGQLLVPIISLAIFNGLLRYGLAPEYSKEEVWKCASIVFCIGSVVTIFATPLAGLYKPIAQWKWYLCLYVISNFAQQNAFVYLKVKNQNRLYALLSIIQAGLLVLFNVFFLVILGKGVGGYLLSSICSFSITAMCAYFWGHMKNDLVHSRFNSSLMKLMIGYSAPFILNDISWWIIHSSDKFMIEWLMGPAMLGIYTAASKIPSLISAFASIFTQAWGLSSIKEYDSTNDVGFYSKVFRWFSSGIFAFCICAISVMKPFMKIYVGEEFAEAWHYVPLLLVSATFAAISSFTTSMYGAMKKSKNIMLTTLVAGIINVIINYVFINLCGVWGAVIGTVTAYLVVMVLRLTDVHRYIKIDYNLRKFILFVILALIEAVFVGLDIYVLQISLICIMGFGLLAYKEWMQLFMAFVEKLRRKTS